MTRVKICGLTNFDDALAAANYGADLLGFIAVPESPRYLGEQEFFDATYELPPFIHIVTVGRTQDEADNLCGDFCQFYEDENGEPARAALRGIRSFRMKDSASVDEVVNYQGHVVAYHLDAYHKDKLGGSGESFNWDLAVEVKRRVDKPIILSGGLTPENVADALDAVRPYAVDVASGVESAPGVKDHAKVRAFIRAVREWDLRNFNSPK